MANKPFVETVNEIISWGKENVSEFKENELSDGYHTFNELYEFRKLYNALLFNLWARIDGSTYEYGVIIGDDSSPLYDVHKSTKHHDGEDCFGGGWFIVVAKLPSGQISNHYKMEDWDLFQIPIEEKAKYPFDGHTGKDVLERLRDLTCDK